jgi:hypothetical protein
LRKAPDLTLAIAHAKMCVANLSKQLHVHGDLSGAIYCALLLRHLFREDTSGLTHSFDLLDEVNVALGTNTYVFEGVDALLELLAERLGQPIGAADATDPLATDVKPQGTTAMESIASVTLRKSRFFLEQAIRADLNDRDAITTNLEAAIVFCRSVTFHLKSQFAHSPGFAEWYAQQEKRLRADRLSRFMLHQRNYVLKVGPASVKRNVDVTMMASLQLSAGLSVQVIRGKPWYKRSLKIILEDIFRPFRENWHHWHRRLKRAQKPQQASNGVTRDTLFFTEGEWENAPALDLVKQQLSTLGEIVAQAEARFYAPQQVQKGAV